mmetsp:Transcript_31456/g.47028  ORF Transcript_31456/g.47028 Transcript_31456/m.47028 type:complete len:274 (-) Transcript_31456:359-1180(-)
MVLLVLEMDKFQQQAFTPTLPMISSLDSLTRLCLAFVSVTAAGQVQTQVECKLRTSWKVSKLTTMESLLAMAEAFFWVMEHDTGNSFSNPVSAVLETTSGCIDAGPSPPTPNPTPATPQPTPNPTPNPTPATPQPTSPPTMGTPTNDPTPLPTSSPTTSSPTPFVATVAKYVCTKNEPLPATICADGSAASGECTTEGQANSCGKGGKMCWWNEECPGTSGPPPAPATPAPTATPPAPTPPSSCFEAGTSCSQNSDCCSGNCPSKGRNPYQCK